MGRESFPLTVISLLFRAVDGLIVDAVEARRLSRCFGSGGSEGGGGKSGKLLITLLLDLGGSTIGCA